MKFLLRTLHAVRGAYFGKHAVLTNTVTAGALGFLGDILAQKSEQGFRSGVWVWDKKRTRNMTIVCLCCGPLMHYWYGFLDARFPGSTTRAVATKLLLDLGSGPIWYGWYIGGISVLRGDTFQQTIQEFKDKVPIVLAVDLALWPIFQGFNFKFFPPQYRVLVLKMNELVLDIIFSHIVNNEYTLSSLIGKMSRKLIDKKS